MWIAQDRDGTIYRYDEKPKYGLSGWSEDHGYESFIRSGKRNKDWMNSLINLDTHSYEIKDGILCKVDKAKKPTPRKHAELACKYFTDDTVVVQSKFSMGWKDEEYPVFMDKLEYREKPKTKTIRFRNFIKDGIIFVTTTDEVGNVEWIGDLARGSYK